MYIGLADKYGTVVGTSNGDKLTIEVIPIGNSSDLKTYPPVATNIGSFFSTGGLYILSGI